MSNENATSATSTIDIPVWFYGSEKLVTGIARTTTCDDVIYSLLSNNGVRHPEIESLNYVIYERWHKVERPLSGRAKLGKVWKAWGPDRTDVKFSVKHVEVPAAAALKAKQRQNRHRRRHDNEKPSDFYDPEKVRAEKTRLQTIEDLVQLVGEQQRKLREQVDRITQVDREIEHYETDVHLNRIRERGLNYVQDSLFLSSVSDDSSGVDDGLNLALSASDLDVYLELCEKVLDLDQQIRHQNSESERVLSCLNTEEKRAFEAGDCTTSAPVRGVQELNERVRMAETAGERLEQELVLIRTQISEKDLAIRQKHEIMDQLVRELGEFQDTREPAIAGASCHGSRTPSLGYSYAPDSALPSRIPGDTSHYHYNLRMQQVTSFPIMTSIIPEVIPEITTSITTSPKKQCQPFSYGDISKNNCASKYHDSDSNSDTGLSSLHSDEINVVLETLV